MWSHLGRQASAEGWSDLSRQASAEGWSDLSRQASAKRNQESLYSVISRVEGRREGVEDGWEGGRREESLRE